MDELVGSGTGTQTSQQSRGNQPRTWLLNRLRAPVKSTRRFINGMPHQAASPYE